MFNTNIHMKFVLYNIQLQSGYDSQGRAWVDTKVSCICSLYFVVLNLNKHTYTMMRMLKKEQEIFPDKNINPI